MKKKQVLQAIRNGLEEEFARFQLASRKERMQGNDDESRAEDKYDTRSTESNYLADGHARQALSVAEALQAFQAIGEDPCSAIEIGALAEIEIAGEPAWFFIGPASGGLEVKIGKTEITVITPESPIGGQLLGLHAGETVKNPPARILTVK